MPKTRSFRDAASVEAPGTPDFDGRPLLKPYSGVGANFIQRRPVLVAGIVTLLFCLPYGFYYAILTPWLLVPFLVPPALLALLVIWVLPEVDAIPERAMQSMVLLFSVALSVWPSYLALDLPGLPWITFVRLIATPLFLILLVSLSVSRPFRTRLLAVIDQAPVAWRLLVLFVVLQGISIAFSPHKGDSISRFVVSITNETAMFFLCAYVFRREGRMERWAFMLWAFAAIICVVGLVEYAKKGVLWANHLPPLLSSNDPSVIKILGGSVRGNTGQYRTQAMFSTGLGCAEYLAYLTPFVLHIAASTVYRPWIRGTALATVPFILLTILATDSRLGILGIFLTIMIYVFVWALRMYRRNRHSLIAPTVLASYPVFFAMVVASTFLVGRIRAKVWGMGQYDNSNEARVEQVMQGLPMIIKRPLGHGVGTAGDVLGFTNPAGDPTIDVYYLATGLDYGILGFFVFYGFFLVCAGYALKYVVFHEYKSRDMSFAFPLCISLFNFFIIKSVLAQDENHPLIFMMAGAIVALVYRARAYASPPDEEPASTARTPSLRHHSGVTAGQRPVH